MQKLLKVCNFIVYMVWRILEKKLFLQPFLVKSPCVKHRTTFAKKNNGLSKHGKQLLQPFLCHHMLTIVFWGVSLFSIPHNCGVPWSKIQSKVFRSSCIINLMQSILETRFHCFLDFTFIFASPMKIEIKI